MDWTTSMYNYPIRPWHGSKTSLAAYPAPPDIAVQIFNRATMRHDAASLAGRLIDS